MTKLGELLAAARNARGWTLREAEAVTGIHNAHISQIENAKIAKPNQAMLWTLSQAYELDYVDLLDLAGHTTSDPDKKSQRQLNGALLHAMGDLNEEEQAELLAVLGDLRKKRK